MVEIKNIETFRVAIPLTKPFKTALRTVTIAESVFVKITCEDEIVGWGEAPPTLVITGDSISSIEASIHHVFKPFLMNKSLLQMETLLQGMQSILVGNVNAKAAVDMALYDCFAQLCKIPLYQLLGGNSNEIETDFTVSVNDPQEMGEDASTYVKNGFNVLKIKVGKDEIQTDINRIKEIRRRIGKDIKIRLDANQGWRPKEAISAIRKMEDLGLDIELVEQPVHATDIQGLKQVTDSVDTFIMADESVFTPKQAYEVIKTRSADLINIKLMKSGGIYQAQIINQLAEISGMECMVGSMIETKLGISAAAHFAASKKNITRYDFDAPLMLTDDIIDGGVQYNGRVMTFSDGPGLGINQVLLKEKRR